MKKQTEQAQQEPETIYSAEWLLIFSLVAFLLCLSANSCATLERNIDNNYRSKNGLKIPPKEPTKKQENSEQQYDQQ